MADRNMKPQRTERYYEKLGRATDFILRCKDCKKLETAAVLKVRGCCECGNKRFVEITTLTDAEQAQVAALDFPYKAEFLAEFSPEPVGRV